MVDVIPMPSSLIIILTYSEYDGKLTSMNHRSDHLRTIIYTVRTSDCTSVQASCAPGTRDSGGVAAPGLQRQDSSRSRQRETAFHRSAMTSSAQLSSPRLCSASQDYRTASRICIKNSMGIHCKIRTLCMRMCTYTVVHKHETG